MDSKALLQAVKNLEVNITKTFDETLEKVGSVLFYDIEDCDNPEAIYGAISDCPTSYYNDNNGNECYINILKIDSDGIHIVEFDDYEINLCINFSEINGFYARLTIVELLEKQLTK